MRQCSEELPRDRLAAILKIIEEFDAALPKEDGVIRTYTIG